VSKSRSPSNRELRTRKDLLRAAARLLKTGRKPTMEEVAQEALVSRPTAYRYFSSVDVLLAESSVDVVMPEPAELMAALGSNDPEARVDAVEKAVHDVMYANEASLRMQLASSVTRGVSAGKPPNRQNRREPLLEAALEPVRNQLSPGAFKRLRRALSFYVGLESMIVAADVLGVSPAEARKVKSWAVRALVRAALAD